MKKIFIICIFLLIVGNLFCQDNKQENAELLEEALNCYKNDDVDSAINKLEKVISLIKQEKISNTSEDYEVVDINRLKNFASRYENKKIKVKDTALSPLIGDEYYKGYYRIAVSSLNQSTYIYENPYENGSIFFIISENLVDKLMDVIPSGYSGFFNIYTDTIIKKYDLLDDKTYYIAKIISLERLDYNDRTGATRLSGITLTE